MVNIDYWLSMANKIQTKTSGTNHLEKQIENLKAEFQQANAMGHRGSRRAGRCRGRLRGTKEIKGGERSGRMRFDLLVTQLVTSLVLSV